MRKPMLLWSVLVVVAAGCSGDQKGGGGIVPPTPPPQTTKADPARDAFISTTDPYRETVAKVVYLPQNWEPKESLDFYFTPQGSQLIPYEWFLALEQPGASTTPFRDTQNILKYRYLPQKPDAWNPEGLPVGFVGESAAGVKWLGLSCAACHTNELHVGDTAYRIDGAPTQADAQAFLSDLVAAVKTTLRDGAKFDRFAASVLSGKNTPENQAELKGRIALWIQIRSGYNRRNFPGFDPNSTAVLPVERFGRLDAVGAIVNEAYWAAVKVPDLSNPTVVAKPANAPVSYPFLWNAHQQDKVQWLGIAQSGGLGDFFSLSRNVGEVIGVFGHVEIPSPIPLVNPGYASTIDLNSLQKLEGLVKTLWSPLWPVEFGAIDPVAAEKGSAIFKRPMAEGKSCLDCHGTIARTDPNRSFKMTPWDTGTDRLAFDNFHGRVGPSGKLEGQSQKVVPFSGKIPAQADAGMMLGNVVIGTILGLYTQNPPVDQLSQVEFGQRQRLPLTALARPQALYEARPLNGIWATAPFLHNGSVPTLDALFRASANRPKSFSVGVHQFDTKKVGPVDAEGFPKFNVALPGNSNAGHEYGSELSEDERKWLIEYVKSL